MDEEEELENTLIGQEEAPSVNTEDIIMGAGIPASAFGQAPAVNPFSMEAAERVNPMMQQQSLEARAQPQVTFRDYDVPEPPRASALSVFTPGGDLKPGIDVNAITPALTTLPDPSTVNTALNQEVAVGSPEMSTETTFVAPKNALQEMLERADERERMGLPRQAAPGIIDAPSPVVDPFTGQTIENPTPFNANNSLPAGMTMSQAAIMNALLDQNQGMDMNQQAISNAQIQGVTQGQETTQEQKATAPSLDQTLSQFMRNEDAPEQRTEQFVDPQGRLRRRLTPEASALQGFALGMQPLAPEYTGFEQASADLQDRLRDQQTRPGESQADRDTRVAQSRTTGGQTEGLSFDDARRRAEGQLAARGIRNPRPSQVNALARSIQAAEPERLEALKTQRAINEARLKTAQATLDRPEFEGKIYTVNGVTFAQTSRGGAQVIDTGAETPEQSTALIQNFEFTLDQIDKAREAYSAGNVDRANDILTAAGIQKNGIDVTANEYFGDLDSQVTPAVPTPQATDSGFTPKQEADIQKVLAANPDRTRAEVIEAMDKAGKL